MRSLTWEAVCRRRLARNFLVAPAPRAQLADVVRAVGGIQAQVFSAAELALGARVAGVTQRDVRDEIWERRALVKTYGPRGTLHLLPADELGLWMAALCACHVAREPYWFAEAGLDRARADALLDAIGDALDGQRLTRAELAGAVAERAGAWARDYILPVWGDYLRPAALTGRLCFGPSRGSQVTYVRPDQWTGRAPEEHDPDEALAAICRRFIAAYGPVAQQDFARWIGLPPEPARRVWGALAGELEEVTVEGRHAWILASTAVMAGEDAQGVERERPVVLRLLPRYDCYVLGCGPRSGILPEAARARVFSYGRGRFEGAVGVPVLLLDGLVAGLWERRMRGRRLELRVEPFVELTQSQRRLLDAEAARVGDFFGTAVALAVEHLGEAGA